MGRITYAQLSKVIFPIGDIPKPEVRRLAAQYKLPSAERHDSQGICFLGKINYNDYIREYLGEMPGDIVELETGKKLGRHKGFWFHTIGQRKGLGLQRRAVVCGEERHPEQHRLCVAGLRPRGAIHQHRPLGRPAADEPCLAVR